MNENLYRRIRPKTFDEVIGNDVQIKQLKKYVESKDRPHTYLFTGGSGCGKTTLARIFARELGADELSIHELDTASKNVRGIDGATEIKNQIQYKPAMGGSVVYIVDEVHKATADWQGAMLKPLEDTPAHVYFILCTTDPQKLIKTIKTRCTQIKVDEVDNKSLFRYLRKIADQENYNVEKNVLQEIVKNSGGSIREALVKLESVATVEDEEEQIALAGSVDVEQEEIINLCRTLLKRNWKGCAKILKDLKTQKVESEAIRYAVLGYMSSVVLNSGDPIAGYSLEVFSDNTYDSKFPGIIYMCYSVCNGE